MPSSRRRWMLALEVSVLLLLAIVSVQFAWPPHTTAPPGRLLAVMDLTLWIAIFAGSYRRLRIYRFKTPGHREDTRFEA